MSHLAALQDEVSFPATATSRNPLLVYFIPGNPGLVEYYRLFIQHVRDALPATLKENTSFYGASHDGFEIHPTSTTTTSHGHDPPFSLDEVIEGTKRRLTAKAQSLQQESGDETPVNVILLGHSVGAYILLEVLTWWQKQTQAKQTLPFTIVSGIPLFPTILHIRLSSKGRTLAPLLSLPFLPSFAQFLARFLSIIPLWLWNWPRTLTPGERRPEHTAVTEAVLRSKLGAKQVVFLAGDEMRSIREDKWHPARLWGVLEHVGEVVESGDGEEERLIDVSEVLVGGEGGEDNDGERTRLFFYWGDDDYWVDNGIRDKFIAERAKREGDMKTRHWPEMVVDRHGMDHCFSLNEGHSKLVAKQVAKWVESLQETAQT